MCMYCEKKMWLHFSKRAMEILNYISCTNLWCLIYSRSTLIIDIETWTKWKHWWVYNICECIFLNESYYASILIEMSLKFVPKSLVHKKSASGQLTHWGRVTHICVSKLTIIGSDIRLSPDWHQAIIWTNAWILLIWPLGTNFGENKPWPEPVMAKTLNSEIIWCHKTTVTWRGSGVMLVSLTILGMYTHGHIKKWTLRGRRFGLC